MQEALLEEGVRIIGDQGIEQLSMRKLADAVGVSRSALYHHYKSKNDLLCDIAASGFQKMDNTLEEVLRQSDGRPWNDKITAYLRAYVHFARDNAEMYNLMFGPTIWKGSNAPTERLRMLSTQSFKHFVDLGSRELFGNMDMLADTLSKSSSENPMVRLMQVCWASLHGLCRFMLDGIYTQEEVLEELLEPIIRKVKQKLHRVNEDKRN